MANTALAPVAAPFNYRMIRWADMRKAADLAYGPISLDRAIDDAAQLVHQEVVGCGCRRCDERSSR